jgi:DNA-binding transcriptional ArsR family regulator
MSPGPDAVFHALADANRRRILERLGRGPASVTQLADLLPISLAAVVQHLQVLEQCDLVRTEKIGRVRTCRIDPGGLDIAARWLYERHTPLERRLDRLAEILEDEDDDDGDGDGNSDSNGNSSNNDSPGDRS